jgi:hypothetical protein
MPLRHIIEPDLLGGPEIFPDMYIGESSKLMATAFERDRQCGQPHPTRTRRQCTRQYGHPDWWKHAYADGSYLYVVWGGGPAPSATDGALVDPEDGTAVDPADTLTLADLRLGLCYRLRDRENHLYVTGGVGDFQRGDGLVEVLDLKNKLYRLLPVEEIVLSDHVLTIGELSWVGRYVADVRNRVKDVAVENYRKDKWCKTGLDHALRDLGMSPYEPVLMGDFVISIPFTAVSGAMKSQLEEAFKGVVASLNTLTVPTSDLDIEVKHSDIAMSVNNLGRK